MTHRRLISLTDPALPEQTGGKVGGLRWLAAHRFAVPATWVLPQVDGDRAAVLAAVAPVVRPGTRYAVRSSASVEDGTAGSHAGQFASVLDVTGAEAVTDAVLDVAASADGAGVAAYRAYVGDGRPITMSVIVQEMVPPVAAGVVFSKNPITGMSETVVEAVVGRGDALMSSAVTAVRWVQRWGDLVEEPEASPIGTHVVRTVVAAVSEMAAAYGAPVDAEWGWDGAKVWWVQMRPITGLEGVNVYSRRISKEVMPGIIKPLVWSVNVPMVNQAWVDLFREALARTARRGSARRPRRGWCPS